MKVGAKHTYDPKKMDAILESVEKAKGSLGQVADLNEIARNTFYDWINEGDRDNAKGLCTDLAQLSGKIRKKQAEVVTILAEKAFGNHQDARFIMWWLSKICREDFAEDSEEIKMFKNLLFTQIIPMLNKGDQNGRKAEEKLDQSEPR